MGNAGSLLGTALAFQLAGLSGSSNLTFCSKLYGVIDVGQLLYGFLTVGLYIVVSIVIPYNADAGEGGHGTDNIYNLSNFWPINSGRKSWSLIYVSERHTNSPVVRMTVENEPVSNNKVMLWFSHKVDQAPGQRDGELYRICQSTTFSWLFLDGYTKSSDTLDHPLTTTRAVLTIAGKPPIDVLSEDEYAKCGAMGQPYLIWERAPPRYRIQVWGYLTNEPRYKWYWDALMIHVVDVTDECLMPTKQREAVEVQEAWWDTFKERTGTWALGAGETTTEPTGNNVHYGRTVWHGSDQLPYLMTGGADTTPGWCVNKISTPVEQ
jgi:hypothetical protein